MFVFSTDWRIVELQKGLDPSGTNETVDICQFSAFWPVWVEKVQGDDYDLEKSNSFWQSQTKDSSNPNVAYKPQEVSLQSEKIQLEEKNSELLYQNKKLLEELSLAKSQLQSYEDQMEGLQTKLEFEKRRNNL